MGCLPHFGTGASPQSENPVVDVNGVEHGKALAARILSAANFVAKIGGIHQDLPALANARQVLTMLGGGQRKEKTASGLDDDAVRGLEGMGRQCSIREIFMDVVRADLERQLALQNSDSLGNGKSSSETTSQGSCRVP